MVYDRLHKLIYDSKVIHADESPIKVIRINYAKIKMAGRLTYGSTRTDLCAGLIPSSHLADSIPNILTIPEGFPWARNHGWIPSLS